MKGERKAEGGGEVRGRVRGEGTGEREEAATVVRENRRKGEGGGEGRVEGGGWTGKQDGAAEVSSTATTCPEMFRDCPVFLTQLSQPWDTMDSPRLSQVLSLTFHNT